MYPFDNFLNEAFNSKTYASKTEFNTVAEPFSILRFLKSTENLNPTRITCFPLKILKI